MIHEDYKELISAHALSALDSPEERVLSAHLSECSECRLELVGWQTTVAALAVSVDPLEPSPQLRNRILDQVRAEGRASRRDVESPSVSDPPRVLPFTPAPRNIWSSFGSLGAIAAVLVFAALLVAVVVLWQQSRSAINRIAEMTRQLQETQTQLDRDRAFLQLLRQPDSRMAMLSGTNEAPDARAMIAYDKTGHAMLMAKGLPAAPAGMAYQLWYIVGNKPIPGRVFSTDPTGSGALEGEIPAVARDKAVFAVTLEPQGGVPAPTGPIYLRGTS